MIIIKKRSAVRQLRFFFISACSRVYANNWKGDTDAGWLTTCLQ